MTTHIILFQGAAGIAVALLAFNALVNLSAGVHEWLADRFTLELDRSQRWPAGRVVRRLRLRRRWDRPGARVEMGPGRQGIILYVVRDDDAEDPVALVQPQGDSGCCQPEWVTTDQLGRLVQPEAGREAS